MPQPGARHPQGGQLIGTLREHRAVVAVLGLGALLRLAVAIEYSPALIFADSFFYLTTATRAITA